jgi:Purine catabolism regulatory protein-like family
MGLLGGARGRLCGGRGMEGDGVALPTVASLCRALGKHLHPADGFVVPETPVTAVHVSELVDPTSYVSGGELLLTTGLILPTSRIGWEGYVSRLKSIGIAALGIGLGPRYFEPPEALAEACKASGLTLLIVPDSTPFLTISKTYWTARARSSEQHLQDEVAAHRALIDAAAKPDPPAEVLRRLARAVDGWAASLTSTGKVDQIHPAGLVEEAEALQSEVARLEVAGVHSAASFIAHGRYVAIFPLSVEETVVGYVAVGTAERLSATHRRIVLTAVALLSIDSIRWQRTAPAREARARCVASLVDLGHIEAARQLAAAEGLPVLHREGRVLLVRAQDTREGGPSGRVLVWGRAARDGNACRVLVPAFLWALERGRSASVAVESGSDGVRSRLRARPTGGHRKDAVPVREPVAGTSSGRA